MKLAVVGGRTFNDYDRLAIILESLRDSFGFTTIVSGGAVGADSLAAQFADDHHMMKIIHIPNWDLHGKAAGFIRNRDIIDDADMVVAFWNTTSRGTENSISLAKAAKKPTFIFYY
jgi:hypothetical protein